MQKKRNEPKKRKQAQNEPKKRKQAQKERACKVFKRKFSGTRPDKFYLTSCRSPSQPCLEFPSRSKSFAFCAALPSCSFTDYSALYAPDVRYKILWIFVTHYGARDVTGSLALWARLRPTENPSRSPGFTRPKIRSPSRGRSCAKLI